MGWDGIVEVGVIILDQSSFGLVFFGGRLMAHADEVVLCQFWLGSGPRDVLVVIDAIYTDALLKLPAFELPQNFQILFQQLIFLREGGQQIE